MSSIFTKIIQGDIPCYKIYEDDKTIAFLDINPFSKGHTLVIPKREVPLISDLTPSEFSECGQTIKHVIDILNTTLKPDGFNVIQSNGRAAGQEIDHVHFHVVPRRQDDVISFHVDINVHEKDNLKRTYELIQP